MTSARGSGACSARGAVPGEELGVPSLLLDAGKGWPVGYATETAVASMEDELAKMAAERAIKFIVRGLFILLWLYLFNSMREYAISYTGGDTRFSTFAAIVVAVPIAEIFCILGQTLVPPYIADDSEVPTEGVDAAVFLDLEKGLPSGYTTAVAPLPRAAMETARDVAAIEAALNRAAPRITKCIVRGLLILFWVYFVDLVRRYIATHDVGLVTTTPLLILAAGVSAFLCLLMESCGKLIVPTKSSQYGAMLEQD